MSTDPRTRYQVLQPITASHGRFFWLQVGTGYRNPDGTIDVYLDAILLGDRLRLREFTPRELDEAGAERDDDLPENVS